MPVVYTASCTALALLEYLAHMEDLPDGMLLKWIDVPDTLPIETVYSWRPHSVSAVRR